MTDLINDFPSWGELGEFPAAGFFYEGGDQVNEKHMDALWNGLNEHFDSVISGVTTRVDELHGDVILDGGMSVSTPDNTTIEVTASSAGAYVNGQQTGSTSSFSTTPTTPSSSVRQDSVWVDEYGNIGITEGSTGVAPDKYKLAEYEITDTPEINYILNTGRHLTRTFRGEPYSVGDSGGSGGRSPSSYGGGRREGDLFYNEAISRLRVWSDGSFHSTADDRDTIGITAGNGLKNGSAVSVVGDNTIQLDVEPQEIAGSNLIDDGSDNLALSSNISINEANLAILNADGEIDFNDGGGGLRISQNGGDAIITPYDNDSLSLPNQIIFDVSEGVWNIKGNPRANGSPILTESDEGSGNNLDADTVDGFDAAELGVTAYAEDITNTYGDGDGTADTVTFSTPSVVEFIYLEANASEPPSGTLPNVRTQAEVVFDDGTTRTFSATVADGTSTTRVDLSELITSYDNGKLVDEVRFNYDNEANDGSVGSQTWRVFGRTVDGLQL